MPRASRKRKAPPARQQPSPKRPKIKPTDTVLTKAAQPPSASGELSFLEKLPDELLLIILRHCLDMNWVSDGKGPCYNLALTSRRLNGPANEILYEAYEARNTSPPLKFVRTIIANPKLAGKVKRLAWAFEMMPTRRGTKRRELEKPSSRDRRMLRESLKTFDMPAKDRSAWEQTYSSGELADLLKLTVLHTPNLRKLDVMDYTRTHSGVAPSKYQKSYLELLIKATNGKTPMNAPAYEQLSELSIEMGGMKLPELYGVLGLPSLQKLTLKGVYADTRDNTGFINNPRTAFSPITELVIEDSFIASEALSELILSCRELKVLRTTYSSRAYLRFQPVAKIDYTQIARAIREHKKSLELFDFEEDADRDLDTLVDYDRGQLGSFHDFPKLHTLGLPFEALPDTDSSADDLPGAGKYISSLIFRLYLP